MRMAFSWWESDLWILPGGGIEKGEDVEDAVVREVFEETGATDINVIGDAWANACRRYVHAHVDQTAKTKIA